MCDVSSGILIGGGDMDGGSGGGCIGNGGSGRCGGGGISGVINP